jgi:hypothetical protein
MVWWSKYPDARPVKNARTRGQECHNCNNRSEHVLYRVKGGLGFGNPLTGRVWASTRTDWVLVCPICEDGVEVSKDIATALQAGGERPSAVTSVQGSSGVCPSCGTAFTASAKFCGSCGRMRA